MIRFSHSGLNSAGLIVLINIILNYALQLLLNINAYNMFDRLKQQITMQKFLQSFHAGKRIVYGTAKFVSADM